MVVLNNVIKQTVIDWKIYYYYNRFIVELLILHSYNNGRSYNFKVVELKKNNNMIPYSLCG